MRRTFIILLRNKILCAAEGYALAFWICLVCVVWSSVASSAERQPCIAPWNFGAADIDGLVFGENSFEKEVTPGLTFALIPDELGWQVKMLKDGGRSIPVRPPPRGIPPEDPSSGQNIIELIYGPGLDAPELDRVPGAPANAPTVEPELAARGQILLEIEKAGYGPEPTSAQEPPQRMVYMDFKACITWNTYPRELDDAHYPGTGVPEDIAKWKAAAFEECGLTRAYRLSPRMFRRAPFQPAVLEADLDGDGHLDLLAVIEDGGGERSLAACLQTDRRLVHSVSAPKETALSSDLLDEADYWHGPSPYSDDQAPQRSRVIIGIEGASSQEVTLTEDAKLVSRWYGD